MAGLLARLRSLIPGPLPSEDVDAMVALGMAYQHQLAELHAVRGDGACLQAAAERRVLIGFLPKAGRELCERIAYDHAACARLTAEAAVNAVGVAPERLVPERLGALGERVEIRQRRAPAGL